MMHAHKLGSTPPPSPMRSRRQGLRVARRPTDGVVRHYSFSIRYAAVDSVCLQSGLA